MDNSKRNVHTSGPLGMLVKSGQIKKVDLAEEPIVGNLQHTGLDGLKAAGAYFKTQSGIGFQENELVFVDPNECEPWEYANRSEDEMGNMDELIRSIKENSQLQPVLVRTHPSSHDGVKYQIIFGRRRHAACLALGIKLLVIKKDSLSLQEAILCQDAENKFRKDVSNYSNAVLYKKLLTTKAFKTEKELAEKFGFSTSTLNDLMMYTKIPNEILTQIPDIHQLPIYMAIKIVRAITEDSSKLPRLIEIAPEIGKSVNTPSKLELLLVDGNKKQNVSRRTNLIHSEDGRKLFAFKVDHKGVPSLVFNKELLEIVNFYEICQKVELLVSNAIKSGRPDLVTED